MIGISKETYPDLPKEVEEHVGNRKAKAYLNYNCIHSDCPWMCAYVVVPNKVMHVECHEGVTYSEDDVSEYANLIPGHREIVIPEGYHVIGWDFAHCDDDDLSVEKAIESVRRTLQWIIAHRIATATGEEA